MTDRFQINLELVDRRLIATAWVRCAIACALLAAVNNGVIAQSQTESNTNSQNSSQTALQTELRSEAAMANTTADAASDASNLQLKSLTVTPLSRVTPGGILSIRCLVSNSGSTTGVGYLVGRIEGQTGEEDRRRVELAAGEQRLVDVQLRLAKVLPKSAVDVVMTLNVLQGGREVLSQSTDEQVNRRLHLPIADEKNITAIALNREPKSQTYWRWPPAEDYHSYEFVLGSRIDARLSRQCVVLDGEPFALNLIDWSNVNALVISEPSVFDDLSAIGIMQQFLQRGGRIWIILEHVDTSLVHDLLDEDQQIETVGTVQLNHFEVELADLTFAARDRTVDSVDPIPMKRVSQQGGTVLQTVDGWPAAIWMKVGRGEILFTCLGSAGWLKPREAQFTGDPRFQSQFTLPIWAGTFAHQLHNYKPEPPLQFASLDYPVDRIGNPVVSRSVVAVILISFCGCLLGIAGWRMLGGQVKWLGVIAPAMSIVASMPLIATSVFQRSDIPPMQSVFQFVELDSRGGAHIQETTAVYLRDSQAMDLVGAGDGIAIPAFGIDSGIRSLTTEDFQSWHLSNSMWPTGTWRYQTETMLPETAGEAIAVIGSEGLEIELPAVLPTPVQDVVLQFAPGVATIGKVASDGRRVTMSGDLPAEGERWTADAIVNDEQRRRAEIYRKLFDTSLAPKLPLRTLCGWTELWDKSPHWDVDLERRGTALVSLPVRLLTPAAGSAVRIPYSMIEIQHASNQSGSSIFSQITGRFVTESTLQVNSDLAFLLPPEVTPLELTQLEIDWDIRAPQRSARLSCLVDGEAIEIASLKEPSIPFRAAINDARILKSMQDGRLELRIEIQESDSGNADQSNFVSWQIKHLRLTVEGRTLARNQLVKDGNN